MSASENANACVDVNVDVEINVEMNAAMSARMKMKILVIDGQGGGIGSQVVAAVRDNFPDFSITAVGTNAIATSAMIKAGASHVATGENAVVVCSKKADVIIGPIGIVLADSMRGEITAAMASAVGQSDAARILIPTNHCSTVIAGAVDLPMGKLIQNVVQKIQAIAQPDHL